MIRKEREMPLTLGQKLKQLRTLNNYRAVEVSAKLNVSVVLISRWENDKTIPSTTNIMKLAYLYNVDVQDLTRLIKRR